MSYSMQGLGAYYLTEPRQMYNGYGAAVTGGGIEFSATQVWSDWLQCKKCYMTDPATGKLVTSGCPACKRGVNTIRAALGQLGFGKLPMGEMWGPADQGAYKAWAASVGLPSPGGMPYHEDLPVMEQQLKAGQAPGGQAPVSYTKVGTTYVPTEAVTPPGAPIPAAAEAGLETKDLLWLGVAALAIVGGVAAYKLYKKKPARVARPVPVTRV